MIALKTFEILEEKISEEQRAEAKNLMLPIPEAKLIRVPFVLTDAMNIESYKGSIDNKYNLEPYTIVRTYEGSIYCFDIPFEDFDKWYISITKALELAEEEFLKDLENQNDNK